MVLKLIPYDFEGYHEMWGADPYGMAVIDLSNGEESGVTDMRIDSKIEKRITSYKYYRVGHNPITNAGGEKEQFKRIRPKDRKKEEMDMQIQGWLKGTNAKRNAGLINYYARKPNLVMLVATDQMEFYEPMYGAVPVNGVLNMDTLTGFTAGPTGGPYTQDDLAIATDRLVEGTGSVKYWEISPTSGAYHYIIYTAPSPMILNSEYKHFWLRCDHPHDDFDYITFALIDGDSDSITWTFGGDAAANPIQPFNGTTWTQIILNDSYGTQSGTFNGMDVDIARWGVKLKSGDSGQFTLYVDYLSAFSGANYTENDARKRDFPFWVIESSQVAARGGRECNQYEYTISLKRVIDPPYG